MGGCGLTGTASGWRDFRMRDLSEDFFQREESCPSCPYASQRRALGGRRPGWKGPATNSILFVFFTIKQLRFASVQQCPGTSVPSATHQMMSLYLFRLRSNPRLDWGPIKGAISAQKALQVSETKTTDLLGGTTENNKYRDEGSLICSPGKPKFKKKKSAKKRKLS